MKEFNKEEYNKMCAEFLGWKLTDNDLVFNSFINGVSSSTTFKGYIRKEQKYTRGVPLFVVRGNKREIEYYREKEMDFTSDWNWIMEVVEKIQELDELGGIVLIKQGRCTITSRMAGDHSVYADVSNYFLKGMKGQKEAVVQALWQFLNWYNQQEK